MSGYIGNIPTPQATQTRETFTATASQTTFNTAGYTPGFVDVWLNGVKLVNGDDFTATNGSDVVLTVGAASGDTVEVLSFSTFEVNSQTFTGGLTVNNDGATVITADRATSDGSIVDFKKDGTTVGSIGSRLGANIVITAPTATYFDSSIRPLSDNSKAIGTSTLRFTDLYLSGGVYLGGTGAANLLDDYEEGTWTLGTNSGVTLTSDSASSGRYTRIGRQVIATAWIAPSAVISSSTNFDITGLPFTSSSSPSSFAGGSAMSQYVMSSAQQLIPYVGNANSYIRFYQCDNGQWDRIQHADISTASDIYVSVNYTV